MLKNKIIGKKIRNIVILLMAIIVMIGAYRYIDKSRAENVIEIDAVASDNEGYLEKEEFKLEAKQLDDGSYEVELPESVNTKKINRIVKIGLGEIEKTATEDQATILEDGLELVENRIYLTKEQIENEKINIEVAYDIKELETEKLYSKILKYEDKANGKLVELKGYLPVDAELQVEEVSQEQLTQIFGDKKIKVAYDIKILKKVVTQVPADEADPNAQVQEIVETVEINPEDFGETCEVSIKDVNIVENSKVYHVKEDNTYEQVNVTENTEGNVSFEAQTFSIYIVSDDEIEENSGESTGSISDDEIIPDEGTVTGATDNTTPTIAINGTTVSGGESSITGDPVTASLYGKYIENYTPQNGSTVGWRIFHVDEENIYLIADDYIEPEKVPAGKNGYEPEININATYDRGVRIWYISDDYDGWADIENEPVAKWFSGYAELSAAAAKTAGSIKRCAYLADTTQWAGFTDTTYADYAIGAAPIELFAASYNVTHDTKIEWTCSYSPTSGSGYYIKLSSDSRWGSMILYKIDPDDAMDGLYIKTDTSHANGMWLGYPFRNTTSTEQIGAATSNHSIMNPTTTNNEHGIRPVVCINTEYNRVTDSDGNGQYELVKGIAVSEGEVNADVSGDWAKSHTVQVTIGDDTGLASARVQYGWSTSNGVEPTSWTNLEFSNWRGATSATAEVTKDTDTGIYYLWVKSQLGDEQGNINRQVITAGPFKLDNTAPTAATMTMKLENSSGSDYTDNTWTSKDVYIAVNNDASDEHSGVNSSTYTVTKDGETYLSDQTEPQTLTQDGTYTITVTTTDNAGNTATETSPHIVKIDKIDPTVATMTMKLDNAGGSDYTDNTWTNQNVYIALNDDASDAVSGVNSSTYTVTKDGEEYSSNQTTAQTLTESGTYTITVTTTDNAGNAGTRNYTVKIDKTAPIAATMTMKLENSSGSDYIKNTWTNHDVYIALNNDASDAHSGVNSSTYTVTKDGEEYSSNQTSAQTLTQEGTYTIRVTTTDNVGNTVTRISTYYKIKIDKTDPTAGTMTMKLDNAGGSDYSNGTWTKQSVYLAVNNGSDALSGHKTTTYTVIKNGSTVYTDRTDSVTLDPGAGNSATYTIVVTTTDNAENTKNSDTYTVNIDRTPPTTATMTMKLDSSSGSDYSNNTWTNHNIYIALNNDASDAHSGVNSSTYTVTKDGEEYSSNQTAEQILTQEGTYIITVTTTDNAGNTATNSTFTVKIDKTKPVVKYTHQTADINAGNKTYTMTFTVTDEHYSTGQLTVNDLTIMMQNGQKDSVGNEITYNLKELSSEGVNVALRAEEKMENEQLVGHTYTLTISNLEQLEIKEGLVTAGYSGIVTVAIPADKITDLAGNTNDATTITSGVDIPGGTLPDDAVVVDVVRPIWRKTTGGSINFDTKTANIVVNGTDTYYASNSLTDDVIKVYAYTGTTETDITSSVTKTLSTETTLNESVIINETTSTRQYGVKYTITLTGIPTDKDQVKVVIPAETLTDQSGNKNEAYEMRLYTTLKSAATETGASSAFLGNSNIQRQNIESITFKDNTTGAASNKWDVSAAQDGSIWAWYTGSGPYQVYIGSEEFMCANKDSSYLFSYIGYSTACTATSVINGLDKLNTTTANNMSYMFQYCGYRKMTSLNLGSNFSTANVTNMSNMFNGCGQNEMTTFEMGITTNTIDFNTAKVTDMSGMFQNFAHKINNTLTLGSNFNTSNVTNMSNMFNGCGQTTMTSLDLGPAFTKIASTNTNFATNCGKSGAVIYAPESIYKNQNAFKQNSTDTTETPTGLNYTRGTIIPIYKPEWVIDEDENGVNKVYVDTENKTLQVTVKGSAYKSQVINSNVTINYASDVTSTLTAEDITVFVDGVEVTSTTNPIITVDEGTSSTNATTNKTEITHTITLGNLEEAIRQAGKLYKEWSGNISIKIGGRGQDTSTYYDSANAILKDQYGNQSMMETDEGQTAGTWINITFEDTDTNHNTTSTMFADFIKPEFTYESANTTIGSGPDGDKKVTVVFDVTDKYFSNTELATDTNADLITVKVDNDIVNGTVNVTKTLTKKNDIIINTQTNAVTYQATGYTLGANERKVGERYELLVEGLEQLDENGLSNGYTYSGPMSIAFPSGKITDLSGNVNEATTITIGVDDTDGNVQDTQDPNGEIVDVVSPVWELGTVNLDAGTIKLIATDKYYDTASLTADDITLYVNGNENAADSIAKPETVEEQEANADKIWKEITGPVEIVEGQKYEYTLQLSNIETENAYITFTPTNLSTDQLNNTAGFKYRNENGGAISIKIEQGTITDQSGNTSREQNFDIGKMDGTQPEVYDVEKIQNATANTDTFIFNVTDRNYDPEELNVIDISDITVWVDGVQVDSIQKTSLTYKPIKLDIDGETGKVLGHQYTVVLSNIAEAVKQEGKSYLEWSGTVEIRIANDAVKDLKGNTLNPSTTTISDFVDYIKPEIEPVTVTNPIDTTNKTYTMSFNVIDKYLDTTNMMTGDKIKVYIDGELDGDTNKNGVLDEGETPSITKTLTSTPITANCNKTVDGTVTSGIQTIGQKYTLVLSNFEQSAKQAGKDFMEWSGTVKIEIAQDAVQDTEGNILDADATKRTVNGEHVDFIKPVVEKVSSAIDTTAKTETIIFNVMDKYLDTSDVLTDSEISVYVDEDVLTSGITKTLTKVQDFTATVNGDGAHVVGQQYQLVLSGFEQSSRNAKDYKDWSGTVSIELAENAVKDTSNNTLAPEAAKRTVVGNFVDFIKPDLEYIHSTSDINITNKTYTMTFDVTDKYYTSGQLSLNDLTILMKNGQKDSNGNEIVYDLKQLKTDGEINIAFRGDEKSATFRKTVDGNLEETATSHVIGHTYTLTISNLEQLAIKEGLKTTLDYSGIITVGVAADKVKDSGPSGDGTNPNGNVGTTITSGVNSPGGIIPDDAVAVDVVDPIWTKVSSTAYAIDPADITSSTATITFRGTDTYFDQNTFTIDDLKVIVNGSEVTTGITKTLDATTTLTEERLKNNGLGTTEVETVQYGEQYTVTIKGFAQNANQVKIRIPKGLLVDESGNDSEETDLIVYNVLKSAASETASTSAFLGESLSTTLYPEGATSVTPIERQNIEKLVFTNGISGSRDSGVQRVWDVSAQGDGSIIAWTSNTTAPYTVYIGSNDKIFANQDSSYLFSYIGYASNCIATEVVANLNLLNTSGVINMSYMFNSLGYRKMATLDLGTFNTENVTNMSSMFKNCGNIAMTTLDLGTQFNTSKVTNMSNMFNGCGQNEMTTFKMGEKTNIIDFNTIAVTDMSGMFQNFGHKLSSLTLGTNFKTNEVTNMSYMFADCGFTAMTTLDLGNNFNTNNVTNMSYMFSQCGYTAMTTLNLGNNFDTSNVTNMSHMFESTGYQAMTSLDLGDKFHTGNVTNMASMFERCGTQSMLILDLGPAFTCLSGYDQDFIAGCGNQADIYAPEAIYYSYGIFKNNSNDTQYHPQQDLDHEWLNEGTIIPVYKPEWSVTGTTIDSATKEINIDLKGTANHTEELDNGNVKINYSSNVTTSLTAYDITVYIEDTVLTGIGKTLSTPVTSGTEVTQTLTITNFEEALRQSGKLYKEWSGNITLKIGGRGEDTSTYTANVLTDEYGNQSMMEIDTTGTWEDVTFEDDEKSTANANGKMFADFIKPEFTYEASNTIIGDGNHGNTKKVTVVFDVTDKYFASTSVSVGEDLNENGVLDEGEDVNGNGVLDTADNIIVKVDNDEVNSTVNVNKTLSKKNDIIINTQTNEVTYQATGYTLGANERKVGERYELLIEGLEQLDENGISNGYTYSGPMSIAIPSGKVTDLSGNVNDATTITVGVDEPEEQLPNTDYTTPYLPTGYTRVVGTDLSNGLTIQDSLGNQYVWVEVPRTTEVYQTAGLGITSFTDDDYTKIENDLHTYTSVYRNGTSYTDTYYSDAQTGLTETQYYELKQKMLKSVYQNGGFYVGKYETGIEGAPKTSGSSSTDPTEIPVIKQNAYPYNYVTCSQAQTLASGFASQLTGYTSSLMFGVQWDLVLKYLETKAVEQGTELETIQSELNSDSTSWGNYSNNLWNITNTSAKYYYNSTWTSGAYGKKTSDSSILLSTGASDRFSKHGIYDLAGNVWEWTLEKTSNTSNPCASRGGDYYGIGSSDPASYRYDNSTTGYHSTLGFRATLYKDVDLSPDSDAPEIVDVVDPVWELGTVDLDAGTIKLIATDKYYDTASLTVDDITLYVNGNENAADSIAKPETVEEQEANADKIWKEITGPVEIVEGQKYEYTLQLSNIETENAYITFTPTNLSTDQLNNTAGFKYRNENGGAISIKIAQGTITDQSGNTSREQTFDIGKMDGTQPEVYDVEKIQNATANTDTFIFNVTDRNYDPEESNVIDLSDITVWVDGVQADSIQKTSLTYKPIKLDIDGETGKVLGHQYTVVLSNIAEAVKQSGKSYLEWSGTVEIRIANDAVKDLKGNTLNPSTTTISDFVDYIKPEIEPVTVTNPIDTTNKTYTMSFNVIDKYLDTTNMMTGDKIKVYIDGELDGDTNKNGVLDEGETPSITKTLTSTPITANCNKTVNGTVASGIQTIGQKYTLVLSNFEQSTKQAGKDFMEWSGTVKIEIAQDAVQDTEGNTLDADATKRTVVNGENGDLVDFIKPVIEPVTVTNPINTTSKTYTMSFNVIDKYIDTTNMVIEDKIKVYVDGEEVTSITKALGDTPIPITAVFKKTVDGSVEETATSHIIGYTYTLELSNFEQSVKQSGKEFMDWSGTVSIELAEDAVKDTSNNNLAPEVAKKTVVGNFVDFIKPDLEYIHSTSDINITNKTYTMTFDVTDKYYTSGQLSLNDLTILMKNGQKDSNGNEIVYDLKQLKTDGEINIAFRGDEKSATFRKTVDGNLEETATSHVIGHTYTLTISNLEQLAIKEGNTTLDYSGIITVGVAADKVKDSGPSGDGTNPNGNNGTTITSGVNSPGGTIPDDAVAVDVVDPIWTKVSSTAYAIDPADKTSSIATITFEGTDTYFERNTFTIDDLEVIVNGSAVTTGITKTLDSTTTLTEERIKNNGLTSNEVETVTYGVKYTVTIKGFAQNANQVKIRIPKGLLVDESGNDSEETDLIVYNVLKSAASETGATSVFLGESVATTIYPEGVTEVTPIERQNIEKVVFVNSTAGSKATGVQRVWDVSAQGDGSIIAWTSNTTAPYIVYIGSNDEIFANQDSSYLFSFIGYASNCIATETITNLDLLNVKSVTNMSYMFAHCGYTAMTTLNLGNNFDTSNVTDMSYMFENCGYTAMTSLDLGDKFDTSSVTNMNRMFNVCGYTAMTSLDLGNNFNTNNVTNMSYMFSNCGYTAMTTLDLRNNFDTSNVVDMSSMFNDTGAMAMTSLNLGAKFDTSSVTDMNSMFEGCGREKMTSLNLGDKFDTSNVTSMSNMFFWCGREKMTSLDLGDKFYTTSVADMDFMFTGCGATSMTVLDLGPAFTKIADRHDGFMTDCGASNLVIYAAEKIYYDKTTFKLGQ